jgi:outer membrane protein assembly factor BamB
MGQVMCADRISGELIWGLDLSSEFGTEPPLWYGAQSPLINQGSVILAPAGPDVLMAAIDLESGELLWTVPNPNGYAMSHSSIIPVQINGTKQFVYSGLGGMTGVSTEGEVLWMVPLNLAVIAPSPVFLPPDRIFQTAGYGAGSSMVRVDSDGPDTARVLWSRTPREGLACEQQTPILFRDRMFGILPKDAGTLREQFVCADTEGQILWTSGMELRFGLGPWIVADNKFFILGDTGILYMADALSDSWKLLDQAMVLNGVDAWGPLAIADGRLLARDSLTLVCLDLRP